MSGAGHAGPRATSLRWRKQAGMTLVELLVGMAIMGVLTAMLLMGWFALSQSWGFTTKSADARDSGRQAMQRLQREIRDAQKPPEGYPTLGAGASDAPDAIIYRARPYSIAFSTTFNELGNDTAVWSGPTPTASPSRPHLVVYRLYSDGELWRFEDRDFDGSVGIAMGDEDTDSLADEQPSDDLSEQTDGEGAMIMLTNVVNDEGLGAPLFTYNRYDYADADLQSDAGLYGSTRRDIIAVQLRMLVDLNPARTPVYADLRGTAQLRNAR